MHNYHPRHLVQAFGFVQATAAAVQVNNLHLIRGLAGDAPACTEADMPVSTCLAIRWQTGRLAEPVGIPLA